LRYCVCYDFAKPPLRHVDLSRMRQTDWVWLPFPTLPLVPVPYPKGIWHSGTLGGFRVPELILAIMAQ
jgi:hypothetical protein